MTIYTIGFTQKTAEQFYTTLKEKDMNFLIDIRLNNKSQLASFSKFPDIEFFLKELIGCEYIHDLQFAPESDTLKDYKAKKIDWTGYVVQFSATMDKRNIMKYIERNYTKFLEKNICLLCSEPTHEQCHRSLVSEYFKKQFNSEIIHL